MLSYDNTVNYAPSFKKIDGEIESINTLLTSLLFDTYTNSTFIYSDINVIRINTSNNYDSIQSLSSSLSLSQYFLPTSDSTNFFLKSNSGIFASSSDLSSKFNVSDSTNFFLNSDSTQFALSSTLSDKIDVSDSTQFALSSELSSKLNLSDSTQFALNTDLSSKLNVSDSTNFLLSSNSTDFALSSELSLKLDASESTYFLPSSDYSTQQQASYLSKLDDLINTTSSRINFSVNGNIYNLEPTTISNTTVDFTGKQLLNGLALSTNLLSFMTNSISAYYFSNTIGATADSLIGTFLSNTIRYGFRNTFVGSFSSNSFSSMTNLKLKQEYTSMINNTFERITSLNINCSRTHGFGMEANIGSNSFNYVHSMKIKNADIKSNTFSYCDCFTLDNVGLYGNKFYDIYNVPIHIRVNEFPSNTYLISDNTFSNCHSVIFNIHKHEWYWTSQTNSFTSVNYVELNIDKNVDIDLRQFLGLSSCRIGGININLAADDDRKTLFERQICNSTNRIDYASNLRGLSFNSTNNWINSGFGKTLTSYYYGDGILGEYCGTTKLNVQGSIISSTGKITDLSKNYFQPKFSPNYNSLKHYMVICGGSLRDYFELDPHALEAGHNNNACENILLMKDYTFYSTLTTDSNNDNYTFIQWPSTELTFPKSDYSNGTLLNTISDMSDYAYGQNYVVYRIGSSNTYSYVNLQLFPSRLSQLFNTSSSSQLYAGLSYSANMTHTVSTNSWILH